MLNNSPKIFAQGHSLQDYEHLLSTIDGVVWEAHPTTLQFTFVSPPAEPLLGYPLDAWLQVDFWSEHLHPDDRAWVLEAYRHTSHTQAKQSYEYRMIAADGRVVWLQDRVSVLTRDDKSTRLCGLKIDITERKQAEAEHLAAQADAKRYQALFELTNDYAYESRVDADNTITCEWLAVRARQLIGYSAHEAKTPDFWQQLAHPDDLPLLVTHVQRVLAGQTDTLECRIITRDGKVHWLRNIAQPVWDAEHKRVIRILAGASDITEQKRAEEALRASEARFRTFVDHATDAFFLFELREAGSVILDVNQQACESLGYSRDELIGKTAAVFDGELTSELRGQFVARLMAGETISFDSRHRRKDGSSFPVEIRGRVIREGDRFLGISLVRDITERKQIEDELRASETRFRTFVNHATDAIFLQDMNGVVVDVNRWACKSLDYTRAELLGMTPFTFDADCTPQILAWLTERLTTGETVTFESHHRRKDGSVFPVEVRIRSFLAGAQPLVISFVRDITERKRAEAALRASEERYRALFEDNPSMYFMLEADGTILSVNRFGAEQLGYTTTELIGHSVLQVFYPEDQAVALASVRKCLAAPGEIFRWSLRKVHKDGHMLWVEESARALQQADGSLMVLVVCEDISERKATEQALIESHNLLNTVIEGTADSVFVKDRQGRYLLINPAGARFIGKPLAEIIGKDDQALFDPATALPMMARDRRIMLSGQSEVFEGVLTTNGVMRTVLSTKGVFRDAQGHVIGVIGISRDVTELKQLEDELRQAQKMEAIGRLAGGVAHDFNNLLTVINGYSSLLVSRLREDDPNRKRLAEIQKAGERAANLTRQLLAFSRKQVLQPQTVSLNALLGELVKLLQRLIGEDIELTLTLDAGLGLAKVDPGQFEQAIVNLAINARDAMPHGGKLIIATQNIELDNEYAQRNPEVKAGVYVQVSVSDSGHGMDESTKAHIFEPFFTTKEVGKGTGLGLAMVYGFVKQSDGHIEVFSEIGSGSLFKLYLPRATERTPATSAIQSPTPLPGNNQTVLLVEDEEAVRELVKHVLQANGYTILEAGDGQEALTLAQQHVGPIHILVTDLVMPRMGGRQLADLLTQAQPELRVLFMSGYTEMATLPRRDLATGQDFLQKPFDPAHLAHKVYALLHTAGSS